MKQLELDIEFVKGILPNHYTVKESHRKGSIHCKSPKGIFKDIDSEDEEHWGYIMKALRKYFEGRFQEVFHNTCTNHLDFTIHLRETAIDLSETTLNKGTVKIVKEEDDPICNRISAGGKNGEYYFVYRGDIKDIKEIMTVINSAISKL